eukprot:CAMPEP_0168618320 /NCGR_PEP_ID=MMETSP0449_2-20121227/6011_1 /TAXON_ID=1082188 /ORGANISM="Strombidium rassoulzadegani, Strain ras09" /LENGTH=249 /DNA_ID=CAMNT_0008659191 /DNA_START=111 /DNA_END=860 /DNA_ORIENTATION=+
MVGALQLLDFILTLKVIHNLIKVLFVEVAIPKGDGDSLSSKSTSSSNSVDVGLRARTLLLGLMVPGGGDIEIDDELGLRNVDSSCQDVRADEHVDLLVPELLHDLVPLILTHLTEEDVRVEVLLLEQAVDGLSEVLGVDEDEGLGLLADLEDLLDKLASLLAAHLELLDVLQLVHDLLVVQLDLGGLLDLGDQAADEGRHVHIVLERGRKEHPLRISLLDVLRFGDGPDLALPVLLLEVLVGLVDDHYF